MTVRAEIYLVDDDESFLRALARVLSLEGFQVRTFDSGKAFLEGVPGDARGCVVADLAMPGIDGLQLQAALAEAGCDMPVVFLTGAGDVPSATRAMRGGAVDFLEKRAPKEQLLDAIRSALTRDAEATVRRGRQDELERRFGRLTPRELEVLREVVSGLMNKQIAAKLGISERTVKMHRTSITTKLRVHSAAQLATLARDIGLFEQART